MEVFLIAAVSANGMIAEREHQVSLDWTSREDLQFFVRKTKEAGYVVMGRTTYETIGKPLPERFNIVMTRSPEEHDDVPKKLLFTSDNPEQIVQSLQGRGAKQVAIIGGSQVYSQFLEAGLITDLYLTVEPVLFGKGVPLFAGEDRYNLNLIAMEKLNDQAVMLHYRIEKKIAS